MVISEVSFGSVVRGGSGNVVVSSGNSEESICCVVCIQVNISVISTISVCQVVAIGPAKVVDSVDGTKSVDDVVGSTVSVIVTNCTGDVSISAVVVGSDSMEDVGSNVSGSVDRYSVVGYTVVVDSEN